MPDPRLCWPDPAHRPGRAVDFLLPGLPEVGAEGAQETRKHGHDSHDQPPPRLRRSAEAFGEGGRTRSHEDHESRSTNIAVAGNPWKLRVFVPFVAAVFCLS